MGPYHAYRFVHDASVAVVIERNADPYKFNVIVRKDGVQVEQHEGLTDKTVGAIVSEHVRVEYIDPPSS